MIITVTFEATNTKRVFDAMPAQIKRAAKTAINKSVKGMQKEAGGIIPRDAGTSVVGYRRVRSKRRAFKVRRPVGSVWQGTLRIPAKYAGKMRNVGNGAKAGKRFFENAFVATMPKSGYKGIFKRKSNGSGIEQVYIKLPNARATMAKIAKENEKTIERVFKIELDKQIQKGVK